MDKIKPMVSVVMSEYGSDPRLFIKSVKSILTQTYSNLEVVLIDDNTNDDIKKIMKSFHDSRIKVFLNKENRGLAYSLNKALTKCSGTYIARADTDDISLPHRIERQVSFLENNKQIDLIGAQALYYDNKGEWGESAAPIGLIKRSHLIKGNPIIHPTIVARKEVFDEYGPYPEYERCEDYALWIHFFQKGCKLYNLNEPVIIYHLSKNYYYKRILRERNGFFRLLHH